MKSNALHLSEQFKHHQKPHQDCAFLDITRRKRKCLNQPDPTTELSLNSVGSM